MPINYPSSNDSFTVPSAPASTPLASAGDSSRTATNNHGDLGLAIVALQTEATYLAHTHDGSFRNGSQLAQANTHQSPDTDSSTTALHHTIGTGANQGAAGNHTHGAPNVWPLHTIFITELSGDPAAVHGLPGTWTQITGYFLVAAGSTFTGGTTGGNTTHTHTATYSTTGGHTHTSPGVDAGGSHSHSNPGSGTSTFGHTHDSSGVTSSLQSFHYRTGGGSTSMTNAGHSHSTLTAGSSGSGTDHSHGVNGTNSNSNHGHITPAMDTQGDHTHTASIASSSHIPPYLSVYVWERTA